MLDRKTGDRDALASALAEAFGRDDASFDAIAEMDPAIGRAYLGLAEATEKRGALEPKHRALISLALSATPTHLQERYTRIHMADAIAKGATHAEICEVLELASVLGIHGFIPGVKMMMERLGGIEGARKKLPAKQLERAEEAKKKFLAARGYMGDVWEANCLMAPDFVEAYATYSGVPWQTSALPSKIKEFIYIAIDLSPTHGDVGGATFHMNAAMDHHGATIDEVMEVFELIGLVGFQTHMMALPVLKDELEKAGKR
jgi:alkylhydroperoxidase/carboxymuconolactone decarboxylase family protein YurZ